MDKEQHVSELPVILAHVILTLEAPWPVACPQTWLPAVLVIPPYWLTRIETLIWSHMVIIHYIFQGSSKGLRDLPHSRSYDCDFSFLHWWAMFCLRANGWSTGFPKQVSQETPSSKKHSKDAKVQPTCCQIFRISVKLWEPLKCSKILTGEMTSISGKHLSCPILSRFQQPQQTDQRQIGS